MKKSMQLSLSFLVDPRFKHKWIEDDVQKEEAMRVLQRMSQNSQVTLVSVKKK